MVYKIYSFFINLLHIFLNITPYPARGWVHRLIIGKAGYGILIDYGCFIRYPWKLYLGSNVSINRGCSLFSSSIPDVGRIFIGSNVALGPGVSIFAAGHNYTQLDLPDVAADVIIDDWVWVGGNSTILPGVRIGEGAIIGAGSIVATDIPAYSVAVGVPAKVIKQRVLEV